MAYVTQDDVVAEFKELTVSSSSAITPLKIADFISEEEAVINGEVATIYVVPIVSGTSPEAFKIMKKISKMLVKARILDQLFVKSGNPDTDQGNPADDLRDQVFNQETGLLSKIKSRLLPLDDAILKEASAGVKSYNSSNQITQVFRKGVNQW